MRSRWRCFLCRTWGYAQNRNGAMADLQRHYAREHAPKESK